MNAQQLINNLTEAKTDVFDSIYKAEMDLNNALGQLKAMKNQNIAREIKDLEDGMSKVKKASATLRRFKNKGLL